jgi:Zn-finger nucleic acid-binding protein
MTYERQGVHLEQCRDCRGIWLDRGELDRLIDAEAMAGESPAYQASARREPARQRWEGDDLDRRSRDWDDGDRGGRPGRRRSMFSELFEGLIE